MCCCLFTCSSDYVTPFEAYTWRFSASSVNSYLAKNIETLELTRVDKDIT